MKALISRSNQELAAEAAIRQLQTLSSLKQAKKQDASACEERALSAIVSWNLPQRWIDGYEAWKQNPDLAAENPMMRPPQPLPAKIESIVLEVTKVMARQQQLAAADGRQGTGSVGSGFEDDGLTNGTGTGSCCSRTSSPCNSARQVLAHPGGIAQSRPGGAYYDPLTNGVSFAKPSLVRSCESAVQHLKSIEELDELSLSKLPCCLYVSGFPTDVLSESEGEAIEVEGFLANVEATVAEYATLVALESQERKVATKAGQSLRRGVTPRRAGGGLAKTVSPGPSPAVPRVGRTASTGSAHQDACSKKQHPRQAHVDAHTAKLTSREEAELMWVTGGSTASDGEGLLYEPPSPKEPIIANRRRREISPQPPQGTGTRSRAATSSPSAPPTTASTAQQQADTKSDSKQQQEEKEEEERPTTPKNQSTKTQDQQHKLADSSGDQHEGGSAGSPNSAGAATACPSSDATPMVREEQTEEENSKKDEEQPPREIDSQTTAEPAAGRSDDERKSSTSADVVPPTPHKQTLSQLQRRIPAESPFRRWVPEEAGRSDMNEVETLNAVIDLLLKNCVDAELKAEHLTEELAQGKQENDSLRAQVATAGRDHHQTDGTAEGKELEEAKLALMRNKEEHSEKVSEMQLALLAANNALAMAETSRNASNERVELLEQQLAHYRQSADNHAATSAEAADDAKGLRDERDLLQKQLDDVLHKHEGELKTAQEQIYHGDERIAQLEGQLDSLKAKEEEGEEEGKTKSETGKEEQQGTGKNTGTGSSTGCSPSPSRGRSPHQQSKRGGTGTSPSARTGTGSSSPTRGKGKTNSQEESGKPRQTSTGSTSSSSWNSPSPIRRATSDGEEEPRSTPPQPMSKPPSASPAAEPQPRPPWRRTSRN